MDMNTFMAEVEHAASEFLQTIWREHKKFEELSAKLPKLEQQTEFGYQRAASIAASAEDPDDVMMAAGAHWETYFGADKERHEAVEESKDLRDLIDVRVFSIATTAGALLQIGKQGISLVHGRLQDCPDGRTVAASQNLKSVIWQGRNQAIHWEDGNLHPPVRACFDDLAANVDPKFSAYHARSLAFDVISLLGWTDFARFKDDMISLA